MGEHHFLFVFNPTSPRAVKQTAMAAAEQQQDVTLTQSNAALQPFDACQLCTFASVSSGCSRGSLPPSRRAWSRQTVSGAVRDPLKCSCSRSVPLDSPLYCLQPMRVPVFSQFCKPGTGFRWLPPRHLRQALWCSLVSL